MKKKQMIGIFLIIIGCILGFEIWFQESKPVKEKDPVPQVQEIEEIHQEEVNYEEILNDLKSKYNNNEIVAILQIPGVLEEVVVQATDNDYYLHYDLYHNQNINGATFLDFRNDLRNSKKLLIYGHSDPEGLLPFVQITNYNNKAFMEEHNKIYLIDSLGKREYEVFSSYIETKDFDYVNLESFGGLTYLEHLQKLQQKSFVQKEVELTENTNILLLQTCSFDERVKNDIKYQIVIAKEIEG